ncbi:MAG TPA: PAS-domain containing protein, partial [Ideonella sp.]|nr:PAS-domain containing protein [Ideonella sp.]
MTGALVIAIAAAYLYLLFAVAYAIDQRARREGGDASHGAWMYALSIAVYCTSWTFYGSVGRSANTGIGFLPIYIGPILVFTLGQPLLRKIVRVAKTQHITTIADFISARYGKNQVVAGLVTVVAVVGIMPYISLQLKAVSSTFGILARYPSVAAAHGAAAPPVYADTALYVALLMSLFVIAFGTRRVDATEQHRGMVGAVALESLVKLAAFLAVGVYVVWGLFDGPQDLFARAAAGARGAALLDVGAELGRGRFWTLTVLAMAAIVCLPRQFQVTVVENTHEQHLRRAAWIFPTYLVAINIFVLPIALAGLLTFPQGVSADTFVLTLPIAGERPALAMLAFIGGLSAATGMIIVETIALSTMICNDLVMPLAIRRAQLLGRGDLAGRVKAIRRVAIVGVLLLGYAYVRLVGDSYALVSIGLVSFAAAAQFAPAMILGLYWKRGNCKGALVGLGAGSLVWAYTLLLPSFAQSGWLPASFVSDGPLSIAWLKPYALFGLAGLDEISHSLLWSMLANVSGYVLVSWRTTPAIVERIQAQAFVDVFVKRATALVRTWEADVSVGDLLALVGRFVDADRAQRACAEYESARHMTLDPVRRADSEFVNFAERLLAGAIGSALARVVMASAIQERQVSLEGVVELLSDASQAIQANWERLRDAIENVSQGICMFDADLRLVVWNRRVLELMGLPPQFGAVGVRFEDVMRFNAERGEYGPGDIDSIVAEKLELVKRPHVTERERPDGTVIELR